ncbi:hypothetical protein [Paeniclostridium hominis]|uniref:hypothetical protein n=1 Tax=Paeniclostridium hominis TaxID=2764329 RepID=UPI0022E3B07E|nr:hypothetical protein [Paeniclostridium hominis]
MVNERIISALSSLNIPVRYLEIKQPTDKYIIFSIYNEGDTTHVENTNLEEKYYISLKYYFTNPKDLKIYKDIKRLMKENGFGFDGAGDLKEGNYKGKELDFTLEITL